MPVAEPDLLDGTTPNRLPFPPVTKEHILRCSIHYWHPIFRTLTPKTRLIPLTPAFLAYLRADGILLPPVDETAVCSSEHTDKQNGGYDSEEESPNPCLDWPDVHEAIHATIRELDGKVHPKLNWSAPKDGTWITSTNSMSCESPSDIYLLIKSSDFITHDLDHAFDDCEDDGTEPQIPYHLALRKSISSILTSMELRCFVRDKSIIGVCQRDLNHYDFLGEYVPTLRQLIEKFFAEKLRDKFPEDNYVFDVYIPRPNGDGRVWLIDINPWAPRTDPLLYSWAELLGTNAEASAASSSDGADMDEEEPEPFEIRIVKRDDPAFNFNTSLYSAHKFPKDVVDAGMGANGGIKDFLDNWSKIRAETEAVKDDGSDSSDCS